MSVTSTLLTPELYQYLLQLSLKEPPLLEALRYDTEAQFPSYRMQSSPEQAQFTAMLVKLMGVERALEIGTFAGYSALSTVLAMSLKGRLHTCEIDPKPIVLARQYWEKAQVQDKIELHLGLASDTLRVLLEEGLKNHFDYVFIDADKINIDDYYEKSLLLIRQGGLIVIDNVLWHGKVIDKNDQNESTKCIRALNEKIYSDARVDISLIPIGDGLTLARKK